jgi:hypothetical protein
MKKVIELIKVEVYKCDFCGTTYEDESDCEYCEDRCQKRAECAKTDHKYCEVKVEPIMCYGGQYMIRESKSCSCRYNWIQEDRVVDMQEFFQVLAAERNDDNVRKITEDED